MVRLDEIEHYIKSTRQSMRLVNKLIKAFRMMTDDQRLATFEHMKRSDLIFNGETKAIQPGQGVHRKRNVENEKTDNRR